MMAIIVSSARARSGSFSALFVAINAFEYCFLDLDAAFGAWKTFANAAIPTASIAARRELLGVYPEQDRFNHCE